MCDQAPVATKRFTADWFSDHIPLWEQLLARYRGRPGLCFLEIGSYEGRSAVWLLDNILTHPTAHLVCVDTFQGSPEHERLGLDTRNLYERFRHNVAPYGQKVQIVRGRSQEVLRGGGFRLESFDFAYIDGSHRARDVLEDAVLTFRLLRRGGMAIFDDYGWVDAPEELERPKPAIDAFLSVYRGAYLPLYQGYQVAIERIE